MKTEIENIFSDENDFEDLKNSAPTLSKLDKKLPFEVPANYFDELPMLIQGKCAQQNSSKISFIEKIIFLLKPNYLFAFGMIILLIGGGTFFYLNKQETQAQYTPPTADEITSALNDNLSQDDETLIIESLPDNTVATTEKTANDQVIVNYLINNDVDENTIIANSTNL